MQFAERATFWEAALKNRRMDVPCCSRLNEKSKAWVVGFLLVFLTAGCVGPQGAGLYEAMSSQQKKGVLEELKKNWQEYDVYCDGPVGTPAALIFDPKNDGRNLIGYQYIKLSKEASVRTAIVWIEFQVQYNPLLYRIFDEERNFYGYVLTAYHLPSTKRIDPKTLQLRQFESMFHAIGSAGED